MGTLHDACETLRDDNKQLRDQLHDLQTGQRALATREEVTEEVTAQRGSSLSSERCRRRE